MKTSRFVGKQVLLVSGIVVGIAVCVFWYERLSGYHLQRQYQYASAMAPVSPPPLLNGLRLDVDDAWLKLYADKVQAYGPRNFVRRRLVLVSSDQCFYCHEQSLMWSALMQTLSLTDTEVVLISARGSELLMPVRDLLRSRGAQYRDVELGKAAPLFASATGVAMTPLTIVLDRASRVRMVTTRLSQHLIPILEDTWDQL